MTNLRELLELIAAFFRSLGIPDPIVHWGHPLMMAKVGFGNLENNEPPRRQGRRERKRGFCELFGSTVD